MWMAEKQTSRTAQTQTVIDLTMTDSTDFPDLQIERRTTRNITASKAVATANRRISPDVSYLS